MLPKIILSLKESRDFLVTLKIKILMTLMSENFQTQNLLDIQVNFLVRQQLRTIS